MGSAGAGRLAAVNNLLLAIEVEVDGKDLVIEGLEWK